MQFLRYDDYFWSIELYSKGWKTLVFYQTHVLRAGGHSARLMLPSPVHCNDFLGAVGSNT